MKTELPTVFHIDPEIPTFGVLDGRERWVILGRLKLLNYEKNAHSNVIESLGV